VSAETTITVEATGETVGEAKWAALRELEQRVPGLDRESVQFQVVSEGERGLLGVGFTPAHVIAFRRGGCSEVDRRVHRRAGGWRRGTRRP
jgi:predicted RNA-binding protein Jag